VYTSRVKRDNHKLMNMANWLTIGLLIGCLSALADEPQKAAPAGNTQQLEFPSGGTLRLERSIGTLYIEGWDRPDMEITTTHPDDVHISTKRQGTEVIVDTDYPKPKIPRNPLIGGSNFTVEYTIKVPSTARLIAHHQVGQVNVDNLSSDIEATMLQGEILLHLPQDGRYIINARSDDGAVNSDFAGQEKRRWWFLGHSLLNQTQGPAHKLDLVVRFGDIVILKTQEPKESAPSAAASKANGI
jgi:hypothetical protein